MSRELARELDHWLEAGVHWMINTGRRLEELRAGMTERNVEQRPHFVVVEETGLFECRSPSEWIPVGDWNERRDEAFRTLRLRSVQALRSIRRHVEKRTQATYLEGTVIDEIIARNETEMDAIVREIDRIRKDFGLAELGYQRNTIYLRFGHVEYQKGSALRALAGELGLDSSRILVAGDHHNDLSMLHRSVAHHLICPSNALPQVRDAMREHGGTVTERPHGEGLADGLRRIRLGGLGRGC